jgi:hypothetical protein
MQMSERYFASQAKYIGSCDPDLVKVLLHDLKMILKRLAYEDSFSRDTHGGGPEHNMHFVPFMLQMTCAMLQPGGKKSGAEDGYVYAQERRIAQFLEQGLKMKHEFLQKLEEEKKQGEIEEEVKIGESPDQDDEDESMQSSGGDRKRPQ